MNVHRSHAVFKLPVEMPTLSFLFLFSVAKKPSGVLSFFRGTGGKSPDLSSQKKETLRGADSAYYQVGQMGKEGAENQGAEAQGTRLQSSSFLLGCYFSQTSFIYARPQMLLLVHFQQSKFTKYTLKINNLDIKICFFPKYIAFLCDKGQTQTVGIWSSLVLNVFGLN